MLKEKRFFMTSEKGWKTLWQQRDFIFGKNFAKENRELIEFLNSDNQVSDKGVRYLANGIANYLKTLKDLTLVFSL